MKRNVFIRIGIVSIQQSWVDRQEMVMLSSKKDSILMPEHSWDSIETVIGKHTDLNFKWINPNLVDVAEENENLYVTYFATLPEDTSLLTGHWVNYGRQDELSLNQRQLIEKCLSSID